MKCLVTSQNVTAPKLNACCSCTTVSLVTGQNVTAPKQALEVGERGHGLVTSKYDNPSKLSLLFL